MFARLGPSAIVAAAISKPRDARRVRRPAARSCAVSLSAIVAAALALAALAAWPAGGAEPTAAAPAPAAAVAALPAPPAPPAGVKWHPGHYVLAGRGTLTEKCLVAGFRGVQQMYLWKSMEPEKDRYDFSAIRRDLDFLRKHDRRLVIQVQTKAFGKGARYAPAYLAGPEYGGGVYQTVTESFNPVLWNDRVNERLTALYRALGREFDRDDAVEAVVIPETAVSSNIGRSPQAGVDPFTNAKFVANLKAGMKAMKEAFPHTVVIQYTNFPQDVLQDLVDYQKGIGVGLGGPDIFPYSKALNDPQKGVYRLYAPLSGQVPLGTAVQWEDYAARDHNGPVEPVPVTELYAFGRDKLHLNYIFWQMRPGYFEKVVEMAGSPAFPKDAAGGLDARRPKAMSGGAAEKTSL